LAARFSAELESMFLKALMKIFSGRFAVIAFSALLVSTPCSAGEAGSPSSAEWEKTIELARKEGKVVAGVPASAALRKSLEETFAKRFPGIEIEVTAARGPTNASKIAAEHAAGVRYYDVLISGSLTPLSLLNAGILEPIEPLLILPEVKEAKRWYGGHIFSDNARKFIYSFQAYQSENLWHNTQLMKAEEFRSFDDLLNPKWKNRIGILDPRNAGSGTSTWAFLYKVKGEEFLRKLAAQEPLLSRDQRLLADNLAKGRLALTIGLTYYTLAPFIKAYQPVKPLPEPKEGSYTSSGSGALSVVKNSTRPNAAKVFVNWLLSKEGQENYGKAMGQATRRLDVDTKWLIDFGTRASKDFLSVEENQKRENSSEEVLTQLWPKAIKLANEILR
jgi:iron(III) transport system substrate-binding protein